MNKNESFKGGPLFIKDTTLYLEDLESRNTSQTVFERL